MALNKFVLPAGILLILVVLIVSGANNFKIYNLNHTYNWGLQGGVNGFMNGLIMNIIEIVAILVALFVYSRSFKDKRPQGLQPVQENE